MKFFILLVLVVAIQATPEEIQIVKDYSVGYHNFTANIYKILTKRHTENFVVSPNSMHIILGLVRYGTTGETGKELSSGLGLSEDKTTIPKMYKALSKRLKVGNMYLLENANKIYVKDKFAINKDFEAIAANYFHADMESVNFVDSVNTAKTINDWVEKKTYDKIKDIIAPTDLTIDTFAVLINAMYFNAYWLFSFNVEDTKKGDFHVSKDTTIKVDMMTTVKNFGYFESTELDATFLELCYETEVYRIIKDVTMTLVLPNDIDGLSKLEENMHKVLDVTNYEYDNVRVIIPKFSYETTSDFIPILNELGIEKAFEESYDFSDMSADNKPLKISKVVQKASISVDESGIETAAASAQDDEDPASVISVEPNRDFIADHPFLYFIRSTDGVVLFIGRYMK